MTAGQDVACRTSFSSSILNTTQHLDKALRETAHADFGGWGVQFSASQGYQSSKSSVESTEYKIIHSSAKCRYYFTNLNLYSLPRFSNEMIAWLNRLNSTLSLGEPLQNSFFFKFFDNFGTHFPIKVTYGASLTYENKLSSASFKSLSAKNLSVEAQASYSGYFSVGGGAGLSDSGKQAVSDFRSHSEVSTIAVGSPPPSDGDATSWASSIKAAPVPIRYELKAMRSLFTADLMNQFFSSESALNKVQNKLLELESLYSLHRTIADSNDDEFDDVTPIKFVGAALDPDDNIKSFNVDQDECCRKCEETECSVFTYFTEGQTPTYGLDRCNLAQSQVTLILNVVGATTMVVTKSLQDNLVLADVKYDQSAKRGKKFNVQPRPEKDVFGFSTFSLMSVCGRFCRIHSGCRGFEIADINTEYAYNCVLYERLGTNLTPSSDETDFQTVFASSNPKKNMFDSLGQKLFNLSLKVNVSVAGDVHWVTDNHCDYSCLANQACIGIGVKPNAQVDNCLHLIEGNAQYLSATNGSIQSNVSMTVAIKAERILNGNLFVRDMLCLNSTNDIESNGASSVNDCVNLCAENGICEFSSFDSKALGNCYLHDIVSFGGSECVYSPGSVLIFPSLMERMKATEIL